MSPKSASAAANTKVAFGPATIPGLFLGWKTEHGISWKGVYRVVDLSSFEDVDLRVRAKPTRHMSSTEVGRVDAQMDRSPSR